MEKLTIALTANGKREFVPLDQVYFYLSFAVHYNYSKISRFTPILSVRIVLSCFYLLITHLLKYIFLGTRFNKERGQEPQTDKQRDNF